MIVVSDTSPLNYLVLIGQIEILPALFGQVIIPCAVLSELKRLKAPPQVKAWAEDLPSWAEVRTPENPIAFHNLGEGESEAIALAQELRARAILIDERDGTDAARQLGLLAYGTLGILQAAAQRGMLKLSDAVAALRKTTFRGPVSLMDELSRDKPV